MQDNMEFDQSKDSIMHIPCKDPKLSVDIPSASPMNAEEISYMSNYQKGEVICNPDDMQAKKS